MSTVSERLTERAKDELRRHDWCGGQSSAAASPQSRVIRFENEIKIFDE
jgi:hypothetical protein